MEDIDTKKHDQLHDWMAVRPLAGNFSGRWILVAGGFLFSFSFVGGVRGVVRVGRSGEK